MAVLKLHEGGYYRLRNGTIIGPLKNRMGSGMYPWLYYGGSYPLSWTAKGAYKSDHEEYCLDIVAEVEITIIKRISS